MCILAVLTSDGGALLSMKSRDIRSAALLISSGCASTLSASSRRPAATWWARLCSAASSPWGGVTGAAGQLLRSLILSACERICSTVRLNTATVSGDPICGAHCRQAGGETYPAQHRLLAASLRCCQCFVSCKGALSPDLRSRNQDWPSLM